MTPGNLFPNGLGIIDYGNREEMVLVGMRNKLTNQTLAYREIIEHAIKSGFSHPKLNPKSLDEVLLDTVRHSGFKEEGYVARFHDGKMVKIKYPDYMHALKMANETLRGRFVKRYMTAKPEEREKMMDLPDHVRIESQKALADLDKIYKQLEIYMRRTITEQGGAEDFHKYRLFVDGEMHPELKQASLRMVRGKPYEGYLRNAAVKYYYGKELPI